MIDIAAERAYIEQLIRPYFTPTDRALLEGRAYAYLDEIDRLNSVVYGQTLGIDKRDAEIDRLRAENAALLDEIADLSGVEL